MKTPKLTKLKSIALINTTVAILAFTNLSYPDDPDLTQQKWLDIANQITGPMTSHLSAAMTQPTFQSKSEANHIYSPFSLLSPLVMISRGTQGSTNNEFSQLFFRSTSAMASPEDLKKILFGFAVATKNITSSGIVKVTNGIFIDQSNGFEFEEDYLSDLKLALGHSASSNCFGQLEKITELHSLAFKERLNNWVKEATANKIPAILSDRLPESTKIVLLNTVLLKAKWPKKLNSAPNFHFHDQGIPPSLPQAPIPAVKYQNAAHRTLTHEDYLWNIALLPFEGYEYAVLLAMPPAGSHQICFSNSSSVCLRALKSLTDSSSPHTPRKNVVLPKLKVESEWDIKALMQKENILSSAFTPGLADFSLLSSQACVGSEFIISKIIQRAILELDEVGVQAAAATMMGAGLFCARIEPQTIEFNHPFKLFVVHIKNHYILFEATIIKTPEQPSMTW